MEDRQGRMAHTKGWSVVVAMGLAVFAYGGSATRDDKVLDSVWVNLDKASDALAAGRVDEAIAYSELVLCKRDITITVDWSGVGDRRAVAEAALESAIAEWETALGPEIDFVMVEQGGDVQISYASSLKYEGKEAGGICTWRRGVRTVLGQGFQYVLDAVIQLRTHLPGGRTMTEAQMKHTAMHELGHVLGLTDSRRDGEVMSVLRPDRPVSKPSEAEVRGIRLLRTQAEAVFSQAAQLLGRNSQSE